MASVKDPINSNTAKVGDDRRLRVYAKSASIQHTVSEDDEEAYQVVSITSLSSGTVPVLHIKNTSTTKLMIITYIRHQVIGATGGTSFPNTSNYFSVRLGRLYASGGTECSPVNVYSGSGNEAEVTCYGNDPTLSGTAQEIDRWYTKADGDMNTYNKEGALIIPPNKTMEIAYVGDQTGGTIFARVSFIMGD